MQLSKTDIGNVQIQPRSVKYDLGHKMGIYRRDRVIRWIGDVLLIHLGTFKPMDRHYVCLGASTWVFDMLSILIGITHP